MERKLASNGVLWAFAIGQLGWSTLSGTVGTWLVNFYEPAQGTLVQQTFVAQGAVAGGIATIVGLAAMIGRICDALIGPVIAGLSDRCGHRLGRRIPFLRLAPVPFGVFTVLVFCTPVAGESPLNAAWLMVVVPAFYISLSSYCAPYNALIPELGRTPELRVNASTYISATYFVGTAMAYLVPVVSGAFVPALGEVGAVRATIGALAVFGVACMLVPGFALDERVYADTFPSSVPTFESLRLSLANRRFRTFLLPDVLYWIALTMFQVGLPYYITVLLGLPEWALFPLFAAMMAVSLTLYAPVNALAKRIGKKRPVMGALVVFIAGLAVLAGSDASGWDAALVISMLVAAPMAVLGILPQAIVADIAEADAHETGEPRQAMHFATRSLVTKLGQAFALVAFTSVAATESAGDMRFRLTVIAAAALCAIAALAFARFKEI